MTNCQKDRPQFSDLVERLITLQHKYRNAEKNIQITSNDTTVVDEKENYH